MKMGAADAWSSGVGKPSAWPVLASSAAAGKPSAWPFLFFFFFFLFLLAVLSFFALVFHPAKSPGRPHHGHGPGPCRIGLHCHYCHQLQFHQCHHGFGPCRLGLSIQFHQGRGPFGLSLICPVCNSIGVAAAPGLGVRRLVPNRSLMCRLQWMNQRRGAWRESSEGAG